MQIASKSVLQLDIRFLALVLSFRLGVQREVLWLSLLIRMAPVITQPLTRHGPMRRPFGPTIA